MSATTDAAQRRQTSPLDQWTRSVLPVGTASRTPRLGTSRRCVRVVTEPTRPRRTRRCCPRRVWAPAPSGATSAIHRTLGIRAPIRIRRFRFGTPQGIPSPVRGSVLRCTQPAATLTGSFPKRPRPQVTAETSGVRLATASTVTPRIAAGTPTTAFVPSTGRPAPLRSPPIRPAVRTRFCASTATVARPRAALRPPRSTSSSSPHRAMPTRGR